MKETEWQRLMKQEDHQDGATERSRVNAMLCKCGHEGMYHSSGHPSSVPKRSQKCGVSKCRCTSVRPQDFFYEVERMRENAKN